MVYTDPWGEVSTGEAVDEFAGKQFAQDHWWQNLGGKAAAIGLITLHAAANTVSLGAVGKIDESQEALDRGEISSGEYWESVGWASLDPVLTYSSAGTMALAKQTFKTGGKEVFKQLAKSRLKEGSIDTGFMLASDVVMQAAGKQEGFSSGEQYLRGFGHSF